MNTDRLCPPFHRTLNLSASCLSSDDMLAFHGGKTSSVRTDTRKAWSEHFRKRTLFDTTHVHVPSSWQGNGSKLVLVGSVA